MAWNERIREAAYTSPSGTRLLFSYENVAMSVDKKTAAFDFPDANGTYIQDLGHTGRKYALRMFFWGNDYDLEADAFEAALLEQGTGKLEHPIYGTKNVVPFGSIKRPRRPENRSQSSSLRAGFLGDYRRSVPNKPDRPSRLCAVRGQRVQRGCGC